MNKQQLANKIWESANRMRSKIEANEYKDYILGFIFYKFLSDKEVAFLKKYGYEDADIQEHAHECFFDFCYALRNVMFHRIIDPFDSRWSRIMKYSYQGLREFLLENIRLLDEYNKNNS